MDLNFTIDFDGEAIHIVVDNATTLSVVRDYDETKYKGFSKLDNEDFAQQLKDVCEILFSLQC